MSKINLSLREVVTLLQKKDIKATMLGIGPMSELVIRATLELGRDMSFPVMLIASRNQIDCAELGGGYVMGWDQMSFSEHIYKLADEAGFEGLLYLCRDHGGPWQRDNEKHDKLSEKDAMSKAKASYLADLKAGFNVLHIDPTKDPNFSGAVPMKTVIARTIELIEYAENQISKLNLKSVSYEVGTEEISGGFTSNEAFEKFISELLNSLDSRKLPPPAFIVGQTGTLVKMNKNVGRFDAKTARELCYISKNYGIGFKEHNADYLPNDVLIMHPDLGITAANVAPEFGMVETISLLRLAEEENQKIKCRSDLVASEFIPIIQKAALDCGRWKKWLFKEDEHLTDKDISAMPQKLEEITSVCGHYVFDRDEIRKARAKLYDNIKAMNIDGSPETRVIESVKDAIMKYVEAFRLKDLNGRIT